MKYKILVEGPYLTMSGYGEHARLILNALKNDDELEIYGIPLEWGKTSWLPSDDDFRQWMDEISIKTITERPQNIDLHIFVGIPIEFKKKSKKAICVTAGIEVDRVDPSWLVKTFELEKIIVPSQYSKSVFLNTTYETEESKESSVNKLECVCPVEVIPYASREYRPDKKFKLDLSTEFNFLSVAQWGPRKNIVSMLRWFVEAFRENPTVGLVLKTNLARSCNMDKEASIQTIKSALHDIDPNNTRKCKIHLLHGDLTEQQLGSLYTDKAIRAIISTTHGEGFGLPLFEAACHALPVVVTNATGHLDFLYCPDDSGNLSAHFAKVDFTVEPVPPTAVWPGVVSEESRWVCPIEASFKKALLDVHENIKKYEDLAKTLRKYILKEFSSKKIQDQISNSVKNLLSEDKESEIDKINTRIFK